MIAQIDNQGRNCYLIGDDYVITDRSRDYYERSTPNDGYEKSEQEYRLTQDSTMTDFKVSRGIFDANTLVSDINHDNRLERSDRLLSEMKNMELSPAQKELLEKSLNAKNHSIILPTNRSSSIPICPETIKIIKEKCGGTTEEIANYLLKLDADNNLIINWADDITMDGRIDERDYEALRLLHGFCLNRYGKTFQPKDINVNDVLFGLSSVFGAYKKKIFQARPSDLGFDKNVTVWKKDKTDKYNFREKYYSDDGTGTLLGGGLGSLLGFALGGWPGLIGGGLGGAGLGRAMGGGSSEEWTQKDIHYYRFDTEQNNPVNIIMFKTKSNYCVFLLDASSSISDETTMTIISEFEEGKLKPTSKEEIKNSWVNIADQKTSGRVSVYDPARKLQVNYQNDKFLGMFNRKFSQYKETNPEAVKTIVQPFTEAKDQITKTLLWQLNQIAYNLRTFQPEATFQNESQLIKDVAKIGKIQ